MSDGVTPVAVGSPAPERTGAERDVTLVELLDRLLEGGVVIHGDVTLAVANIDLVHVALRLVAASVDSLERDASIEARSPPWSTSTP